jgi:hypothetical protein
VVQPDRQQTHPDCGDVVATTRRLLTRATGDDSALIAAQLEVCLMACRRSHEMCIRTAAAHEHCRLCAAATDRAADACRRALEALRADGSRATRHPG